MAMNALGAGPALAGSLVHQCPEPARAISKVDAAAGTPAPCTHGNRSKIGLRIPAEILRAYEKQSQ
jgi:hypothetical protein